jgi:nitrogenase molybdenum-iron protein alpha/beta subunit
MDRRRLETTDTPMTPPRKPLRDAASTRKEQPRDGKPQRYAAKDEPFWKRQETRLAGQLGQPCCTLSGMCTLLGAMAGDFAVIIHGERDCGNSFVHHRMESAERFFCTCLTEEELTLGRVDEPLERCLHRVLDEVAPDAVIVLGTCPITMIGADPGPVVERVAAQSQTETPILLLRTGGLNLSTQAEMVDWLYASLAGLPQVARHRAMDGRRVAAALRAASLAVQHEEVLTPQDVRDQVAEALITPPVDRCVNFIGLPADGVRSSELATVLGSANIHIAGLYPFEANLRDWRSIAHAAVNIVADRRLYPRLLAGLEQNHAVGSVQVPLPIGLTQSLQFYGAIGDFFGAREALDSSLEPLVAAARARVEAFSAQTGSIRMAMGLRMLNNYQVDQLAYEGLGDVEALAELGFDLTLLVQGPPEERSRFEEMLAALGVTLPMHVFPSPWDLAPLLVEGAYQVAYLADHSWEEAQKAGVPMIKSRGLAPMLSGIDRNLTVLAELLRAAGQSAGPTAGPTTGEEA